MILHPPGKLITSAIFGIWRPWCRLCRDQGSHFGSNGQGCCHGATESTGMGPDHFLGRQGWADQGTRPSFLFVDLFHLELYFQKFQQHIYWTWKLTILIGIFNKWHDIIYNMHILNRSRRNFPGHVPLASTTCEACIAQDHAELKAMSIKLLDNFIAKCDSMCVLFTWTYLERLWCVWLGRIVNRISRKEPAKDTDKAWQSHGFAIGFILLLEILICAELCSFFVAFRILGTNGPAFWFTSPQRKFICRRNSLSKRRKQLGWETDVSEWGDMRGLKAEGNEDVNWAIKRQ